MMWNESVLDQNGCNQLHHACGDGKLEDVVEMLALGFDVDATSHPGLITPLHIAALMGYTAIVKALLEHGADISALDANGHPPVIYAVYPREETIDCGKFMIRAGAVFTPLLEEFLEENHPGWRLWPELPCRFLDVEEEILQ